MIYQLLNVPLEAVKRWGEQMWHRAQGHIFVTVVPPGSSPRGGWALNTCTDKGKVKIYWCYFGPERYDPWVYDITVTGGKS